MDGRRTLRALLTLLITIALCYAVWAFLERPDQPQVRPANTPVLHVAVLKDGDSFDASNGVEYRLGMVNAPEPMEPCHDEARDFTRQFLRDGFTADDYARDPHGRHVAEVFNLSGDSLNVALAEAGYSDDRYLDNFRHENRDLARRLDAAFDRAATPACRTAR